MFQIKKWEIWGAILSIIAGSLLHFTYGWSGNNKIVAIFGAVNESTWEHLKLAFWPTLIIVIIEYFAISRSTKNFFLASFVKLISMPLVIVGLFYVWLAVFPDNFIWDISIFVIAVIAGYVFSYKILTNKKEFGYQTLSALLILLMFVMYASFTYCSPKNFLFRDPVNGGYGIEK